MKRWLAALCAVLAVGTVGATVQTQVVDYEVDGETFTGYFAWDDAVSGPRPGVLVLHEWWGHNEYARQRARMLAELGYTAFALDLYGSGKLADHPDDAQRFARAATGDPAVVERRLERAHELLREHPMVNPGRTAAIGYCMGGGLALHMARSGRDLDAVVSFHGSLGARTEAAPGDVGTAILVLTGGADPLVPPEQVQAFRDEMDAVGADYRVHVYPEALHSFTNPEADGFGERFGMPVAYDPDADADSWRRMRRFLAEHLQ